MGLSSLFILMQNPRYFRPKMQKSHLVGGFFVTAGGLDYKPDVP
jgi:hypothetical protein